MKRYYYRGREISSAKATLMCYGTLAGIIAGGCGIYGLMIMLLSL